MIKLVEAKTFSQLRANFPNATGIRLVAPGKFQGRIEVTQKKVIKTIGNSYKELSLRYGDHMIKRVKAESKDLLMITWPKCRSVHKKDGEWHGWVKINTITKIVESSEQADALFGGDIRKIIELENGKLAVTVEV